MYTFVVLNDVGEKLRKKRKKRGGWYFGSTKMSSIVAFWLFAAVAPSSHDAVTMITTGIPNPRTNGIIVCSASPASITEIVSDFVFQEG
jgi:hypothetical protein